MYEYLREMLRSGNLTPGSTIQTATLAKQLGISKTPLRDALIQLQAEGFLRILPQRGVVISTLNSKELEQIVEILGALESKALMRAFPRIDSGHIEKMKKINEKLISLISAGDRAFRQYNELNIAFHDVFLNLCDNHLMVNQIRMLKERMYHFPDRDYGDVWRQMNADEHRELIELIETGRATNAADFIRDKHWSFDIHKSPL
ncbi:MULTISPECIES: GntR family transcriptional regulator [unclassified Burkholderia]|uniref:GntR family transcriptional regulator n=1 Tax=unclassified Burkholderia TaxID=2613784 RepID=UPI002AB258C1|nr:MULTISPECIES: GntR family transcriptional regulator [unclassified Burkholderia]